jgi:hypothetical protein
MCFYIEDKFRTNPKSLKPGGSEVTVIYGNQECRVYDKVKHPRAYIKTFDMTCITKILVDEVEVYNNEKPIS